MESVVFYALRTLPDSKEAVQAACGALRWLFAADEAAARTRGKTLLLLQLLCKALARHGPASVGIAVRAFCFLLRL